MDAIKFFWYVFGVLAVLIVLLTWYTKELQNLLSDSNAADASFKRFQRQYLLIYLIVMGADWLQGPYVYALYSHYGFDKGAIAELFVAGFLSSAVFGTFVGSLADKYGRRKLCLAFSVFYSASCLTKLHNNYNTLMLGRILSGIATSLLFSSFEAWMVHEHMSRGWSLELLSRTFSVSIFGNGVVAIVMGLFASTIADTFGYVAPFMASLGLLILALVLVAALWTENYGDKTINVGEGLANAVSDMRNDARIPCLGMVQSLFEAAMYTFVFMWTPALTEQAVGALPFGVIFACFMVCIMIGSAIFRILLKYMAIEELCRGMLVVAMLSLAVPYFTRDFHAVTAAFLVFEVCCGIYFPVLGTLRGKLIPEATRSAIMNFFRVPLNLMVVGVLLKVSKFDNSTVFAICSLWLLLAFLFQSWLMLLSKNHQKAADARAAAATAAGLKNSPSDVEE